MSIFLFEYWRTGLFVWHQHGIIDNDGVHYRSSNNDYLQIHCDLLISELEWLLTINVVMCTLNILKQFHLNCKAGIIVEVFKADCMWFKCVYVKQVTCKIRN